MTKIRRVPLGFDWPLHQTWGGYLIDPDLRLPSCPDCAYDGRSTGYSPEAWGLFATFYANDMPVSMRLVVAWHNKITQHEVDLLLRKGRLVTWATDHGERVMAQRHRTAAEVNAAQDSSLQTGPHLDSSDQHTLVKYRCKRLRVPFLCATCDGKAHAGSPDQVAALKAWRKTEPPTGTGWQAWEDISEGSPISPAFETREELLDWFTDPTSTYGQGRRGPLTREQAEALVASGCSVGSAVTINGTFVDGDRAVAAMGGGS